MAWGGVGPVPVNSSSYWYNANENNQTITLPFDSSEEMHQYVHP
jgi:hypothetical protein